MTGRINNGTLRIHAFLESSNVNGPGTRAVVWLQGCSLNCLGCWNQAGQDPRGGRESQVDQTAAPILSLWRSGQITGVTVSGGEPMDQALGLAALMELLRESAPAMSLGMFSGYTERELQAGNYGEAWIAGDKRRAWLRIQAALDFAVLGRFNYHQPSDLPLRTSRNQVLRLFTARHSEGDFQKQAVEVTIDGRGLTQVTGFAVLGEPARR